MIMYEGGKHCNEAKYLVWTIVITAMQNIYLFSIVISVFGFYSGHPYKTLEFFNEHKIYKHWYTLELLDSHFTKQQYWLLANL